MPTSSNLNSTGISLSFTTSCIFSLLALAEAIAALLADHWFDYANQSANSINLWQSCAGSNCTAISYNDVNIGLCTLSGKEVQGRFFALRGLLIAGAVFSLFYTIFIAVGRLCDSVTTHIVGVVCAVIGVFCFISVIGLFYDTAGNYLFCGENPCSYFAKINPTSSSQCYYMYGGAYGLVWCAALASLLAAIIGAIALVKMRSPDRMEKLYGLVAPKSRPGDASFNNNQSVDDEAAADQQEHLSANRRAHQDQTSSAALQQQRAMPQGLEEWRMNAQDFEWDENSQLYYSDEAQVYLDKKSNQFFDCSRRLWFDPVDRIWKGDA